MSKALKNISTSLFIPGLWSLLRHGGDEALAQMPSLQRMLRRCDSKSDSTLESEALLLMQFGWQASAGADVPVAALERLALGKDCEGFWFRADPVNLQEDQNYLMMSYPSLLDLDQAEAMALAESINRHFAEDGWSLYVDESQRWYLKLDQDPGIQTTPAWRVVGRDVFGLMPRGENSRQWHAWLMELQMLLFNHPVNESRIGQGKAPVSGLWLWGGGELPLLDRNTLSSTVKLAGNSLFVQGLAKHSGCEITALSADPQMLSSKVQTATEQLVVLEHARLALVSGDMEQGMAALRRLEKEVFNPALSLLRSKKLQSLTIIDSPGQVVKVSAGGVRKWWRRNQPVLE